MPQILSHARILFNRSKENFYYRKQSNFSSNAKNTSTGEQTKFKAPWFWIFRRGIRVVQVVVLTTGIFSAGLFIFNYISSLVHMLTGNL